MAKTRTCPECDGKLIPIVYGMPGVELWEAEQRGEVILGGCVIEDDSPSWQCAGCGKMQK